MLGRFDSSLSAVQVMGGGISGLIAAYQLQRLGYDVVVVEEQNRVGGLIRTERCNHGLAESAAHSLLESAEVKALFDSIGLGRHSVDPSSRRRYIVRNGRPRRWPLSVLESIGLFARILLSLLTAPWRSRKFRSLKEWSDSLFGSAATTYLLNPFLRGIYAARPEEISFEATFGNKKRSRGALMVAPQGGMENLVRALASHLRVTDQISKNFSSINTVVTLPAPAAAQWLMPHSASGAEALSSVLYLPLVSVTAFVSKKTFPPHKGRGVGALYPEVEKGPVLGVLFNSSSFPGRVLDPEHVASFSVILGGSSQPEVMEETDDQIMARVRKGLGVVLSSPSVEILEYRLFRWPRALPLYSPALPGLWTQISDSLRLTGKNLSVFGNYSGEISIRGLIEASSRFPRFVPPSK